eukprot:s810_g13.t1
MLKQPCGTFGKSGRTHRKRRNVTWVMCLLLAVPVPSFVGAWPQRLRGDKCQAQAMDVATMGGAVFGTSVALIFGYDWLSRKELERPYLEMRVVDALINEDEDELMQRVEALTLLKGEGLDQPNAASSSGWSRVYGVAEPLEKLSYQSEALRISGEERGPGNGWEWMAMLVDLGVQFDTQLF